MSGYCDNYSTVFLLQFKRRKKHYKATTTTAGGSTHNVKYLEYYFILQHVCKERENKFR